MKLPAPKVPGLTPVMTMVGGVAQNSLAAYGLSFSACVILQEYGLVVSDLATYSDYQNAIVVDRMVVWPLTHQSKHWVLERQPPGPRGELRMEGMQFSAAGRELLPIVDLEPVPTYTEALKGFLKGKSFEMKPFDGQLPR